MAKILVVADVPWVANDVHAALTDPRFSIEVLEDPRAVPDRLVTGEVDVILVDFQIGSMGGMAVTRSVRSAAATSGMPRPAVILLLDRAADAFLAGRSGADGWVRKPFHSEDLRQAIDAALEGVAEAS